VKVDEKYQVGTVATYIPPLAKANPNWFSTSFCSTDGQFAQYGDINTRFSI
jgi:glutaminase